MLTGLQSLSTLPLPAFSFSAHSTGSSSRRAFIVSRHSVEALARLVAHAAPEADAALLEALSEKLKQSPQATKDLQRTLSLKLLSELSI
jgi:hypothetical protein